MNNSRMCRKRNFNLKFNFDSNSHRFPIRYTPILLSSFSFPNIPSLPGLSSDPSRDHARDGRTRKSTNATRGTSSVEDEVGGQRELIGCKGQFQFGASGTLGKRSRSRLHRAAFLSRCKHRRGGRTMRRGRSFGVIEPARLDFSEKSQYSLGRRIQHRISGARIR